MADGPEGLPPSEHHRVRRTGKALVTAVACLVFVVTAAGWTTTQWLDGQLRGVLALDPDSAAITDADSQRGDENVLLVGSDSRTGAQQGDGVGNNAVVGGARSDTVMVAHLPADRSRAVVVSFPRDLQIQRPPCEVWDPASGYTGRTDAGTSVGKLNTAYEIGGPLCVTKVVQDLSGLAVTRFVGVDFHGFKSMVDAVGGVRICVERPLKDSQLGTIIPQQGYSTISGTTALNYVRARHITGDPTSDYGRISRQQHFLSALLRQVLSPGVLLSPAKVRALITAVAANTVGQNVDSSALLTLAQSVRGLDPANVTFVTVPPPGWPASTATRNSGHGIPQRCSGRSSTGPRCLARNHLGPSSPASSAAPVPPVVPAPSAAPQPSVALQPPATVPLGTINGGDTVCS